MSRDIEEIKEYVRTHPGKDAKHIATNLFIKQRTSKDAVRCKIGRLDRRGVFKSMISPETGRLIYFYN